MIEPDNWVSVWNQLDGLFNELSERVRHSVPGMKWTSGHSSNQAFPFRAYASFRYSDKGADCSVDCKISDKYLILLADIARDDGYVLADLPAIKIPLTGTDDEVECQLNEAITQVKRFFEQHIELVGNELR